MRTLLLTSVERVWQQMKEKAAEYAREGITPTHTTAKILVSYLMHNEYISPKPDKEVVEFYARELIALSKEALDEEQRV